MFDPSSARVVYAADDAFAPMLGVSLLSLYESSRDMADIFVTIQDGGISPENRAKIEKIAEDYHRAPPCWTPAEDIEKALGMPVKADRGSSVQYARLFLDRQAEGERALYVDSDVIFRHSVRDLWNLNLEGKTAAALLDAFSRAYRADMGLAREDGIYNYGVMLVDLRKWRETGVETKALDFLRQRGGRAVMSDLGALNAALSRDTLPFPPRFNAVTIFFDFTYPEMLRYRKPPRYYARAEVEAAVRDPAVVHFTSSFLSSRPWEAGCRHPFAGDWNRYAALTPFHPIPRRAKKQRPGAALLIRLPRFLMLPLAALLQAYIRPLLNRRKRRPAP